MHSLVTQKKSRLKKGRDGKINEERKVGLYYLYDMIGKNFDRLNEVMGSRPNKHTTPSIGSHFEEGSASKKGIPLPLLSGCGRGGDGLLRGGFLPRGGAS